MKRQSTNCQGQVAIDIITNVPPWTNRQNQIARGNCSPLSLRSSSIYACSGNSLKACLPRRDDELELFSSSVSCRQRVVSDQVTSLPLVKRCKRKRGEASSPHPMFGCDDDQLTDREARVSPSVYDEMPRRADGFVSSFRTSLCQGGWFTMTSRDGSRSCPTRNSVLVLIRLLVVSSRPDQSFICEVELRLLGVDGAWRSALSVLVSLKRLVLVVKLKKVKLLQRQRRKKSPDKFLRRASQTEPSCRQATVMSSSLQNPDLYRADSVSNTNPTNPSLLSHLIGAHLNKLVSDLSRLRKLFPLDPSDGSSAESSCDRVCEIVKKEEWGDDVEKQMRVLKVEFGSESLIEV
ncbi:unnamed protein product [Brassica oleracea var. botrytis]